MACPYCFMCYRCKLNMFPVGVSQRFYFGTQMSPTPFHFEAGFRICKQTEISVSSCYRGSSLLSHYLLEQGVCLSYSLGYSMQTMRQTVCMSEKEETVQNGGLNMEAAEQIEQWKRAKQSHLEHTIFNVHILARFGGTGSTDQIWFCGWLESSWSFYFNPFLVTSSTWLYFKLFCVHW